jgi:hypothetical protein
MSYRNACGRKIAMGELSMHNKTAGSEAIGSENAVAWSRTEKAIYIATAIFVIGLAYAYCFHMSRGISFDEIGLHNPIYMYLTTGRMTYPMHGQFNYMVVHPPTHYLVAALLMKGGLPLFSASAAPLFALTGILTVVVYTGRFQFFVAVALLLGFFCSVFIWSEFYTVRPDLIVTVAWFVGLVTFQAAKNCAWSSWRLLVASMFMVYAASCHYWGVAALASILVPIAALVYDYRSDWRRLVKPLSMVFVGGAIVGLPFLIFFVIPYTSEILEMIRGVQGQGGLSDAFRRHLLSYAAFAQRIEQGDLVSRMLVTTLTAPVLLLHVPASFVAFPILVSRPQLRLFGCAGIVLPLFIIFFSQGKQVGYRGYFTPEIALYLVAILFAIMGASRYVLGRWASGYPRSKFIAPLRHAAYVLLAIVALLQVPFSSSSGNKWSWTRNLDALETSRAAALAVLGPRASVATISAGNWYTGGGHYVWNAFDELIAVNRKRTPVGAYLTGIDAIVVDNNYWNATPQYAPVGEWYRDGILKLRGFVFPDEPLNKGMMNYFLSSNPKPIVGFLLKEDIVERFDEALGGSTSLIVLTCDKPAHVRKPASAIYQYSYAYNAAPSPTTPQMVFLVVNANDANSIVESARPSCTPRDLVRGTLTRMTNAELREQATKLDEPIKFVERREEFNLPTKEQWTNSRSISLSEMATGDAVEKRPQKLVGRSAALPWAYIGRLDLAVQCISSGGWVVVALRVQNGEIGVGVENLAGNDFLVRRFLPPSNALQSIHLPLESFREAGKFVVQNGKYSASSGVEIESVQIVNSDPNAPTSCASN